MFEPILASRYLNVECHTSFDQKVSANSCWSPTKLTDFGIVERQTVADLQNRVDGTLKDARLVSVSGGRTQLPLKKYPKKPIHDCPHAIHNCN